MQKPAENSIKAWSREYEEKPFYFLKDSEGPGMRLIAWSEQPVQIKKAFYGVVESFPDCVNVPLKISAGCDPKGNALWSRYFGKIEKRKFIQTIQDFEIYVFSDGMHQLCVKIPETKRYLTLDEHGVLFLYQPETNDEILFQSLGFENRYAEPIWGTNFLVHTPPNAEQLEMNFKSQLGLQKVKSDIE